MRIIRAPAQPGVPVRSVYRGSTFDYNGYVCMACYIEEDERKNASVIKIVNLNTGNIFSLKPDTIVYSIKGAFVIAYE